jgi:hypothetical protein
VSSTGRERGGQDLTKGKCHLQICQSCQARYQTRPGTSRVKVTTVKLSEEYSRYQELHTITSKRRIDLTEAKRVDGPCLTRGLATVTSKCLVFVPGILYVYSGMT